MQLVTTANTLLVRAEMMHLQSNVDIIDAVVHLCATSGIELEAAAAVIRSNPIIKSRIQVEAENLNFLKRGARLPF